MDVREIGPAQWEQIGRSIAGLVAGAGLGIGGALTALTLRVVLPESGADDLGGPARWLRWTLTACLTAALVGMVAALAVGLSLAIEVLASIYPRFSI